MKVVILEDEKSAADNLKYLLSQVDDSIRIEKVIDTVADAIDYFQGDHGAELAFFDIHLADGNSFEIFEKVNPKIPIIFTTAYDEYALKAFKVSSIDYLLKPIDEDELRDAVERYKASNKVLNISDELKAVLSTVRGDTRKYRSSFLVQQRDFLIPVNVSDVAYITIDAGVVKAMTFEGKGYVIDEKLEDIEANLDPHTFFRANRQFIVQRRSVVNLNVYFNGKLILNIHPTPAEQIIISKAKAPQLREWLF